MIKRQNDNTWIVLEEETEHILAVKKSRGTFQMKEWVES